jgi:AcrR family transcriptional regulator
MVELVARHGYPDVTVRGLVGAAGVSTRTFYKHFANVGECFAATYEVLMRCALGRVSASLETAGDWERDLRVGLLSLMKGVAEQPKEAHLALVDSFAGGPSMLERMRVAVSEFEQLLTDILTMAPERTGAGPSLVTQGMAAGVMRVARAWLLTGRGGGFSQIADELADWMLSLRGACATERADSGVASVGTDQAKWVKRGLLASPLEGVGGERGRILAAVAKLSASEGHSALTVTKIRAAAGVSRRNFDAQFADVDECFLEASEALAVTAVGRAERRAWGAGNWERGVYRASVALCTEVVRHSSLAQLGFVDIFEPGRAGLERRERLVTLGADRLRKSAPARRQPSELAAEASIAAAWRILREEIRAGRRRDLAQVAPLVAYVLLAPSMLAPDEGSSPSGSFEAKKIY